MSNPIGTTIVCLLFIGIMAFQLYPTGRELSLGFVIAVWGSILFAVLINVVVLYVAYKRRRP